MQSPQHKRLRDFGAFEFSLPAQNHSAPLQQPLSGKEPDPLQPETTLLVQHQTECLKAALLRHRTVLFLFVRLSFTITGCFFLITRVIWSSFPQALAHIQGSLLLMGGLIALAGILIQAYRWRSLLLMERIHFEMADLIKLYLLGTFFLYLHPGGALRGEELKARYIGRIARNLHGTQHAAVRNKLVGFLSMLLLTIPSLFFGAQYLSPPLILWFIVLTLCTIAAISVALLLAQLFPELAYGPWSQYPLMVTLMNTGSILNATLRKPHRLGKALLYSTLSWLIVLMNCQAYALALGLQLPLAVCCLALALAELLNHLPLSYNGWGVRELALISAFMAAGISSGQALLLTLILDGQLLGAAFLGRLILQKLQQKKQSRV